MHFDMKKIILITGFVLLISLHPKAISADPTGAGTPKNVSYQVLEPTGKSHLNLPVLQAISPSDPRWKTIQILFEKTFIKQAVRYNDFVQALLIREGRIKSAEPAYLLISGRMGGFPMKGFYLTGNGKLLDKSKVPYVELAEIDENYQHLSSITQIYPHELFHVYFEQLAGVNPANVESYSTDIHYFSIITDYFKAFNEGYAESFENVSRFHETNKAVKEGIAKNVEQSLNSLDARIAGFDRDYRWPLRLGFYRLGMPAWYQQLENYKRYVWAGNGKAIYKAQAYSSCSIEKSIAYRNACTKPDLKKKRNLAQAISTEGVINTFFTRLMKSELKNNYLDRNFYLPFSQDTITFRDPRQELDPVANQVIKEFTVIHTYLSKLSPGASPFIEFIKGYGTEFPGEKSRIEKIFLEVTGSQFPGTTPPELWVLNREHSHSAWTMAQFGGAKVPYYTFNLNTAGWMDLQTIKGISAEDARKIEAWRDSNGLFDSFGELEKIPGLKHGVLKNLEDAKLIPSQMASLESSEGIDITGFLLSILFRVLLIGTVLAVVISGIQFLLFYSGKQPWEKSIFMLIHNLFKSWMFLIIPLLAFAFPNNPFLFFLPFMAIILSINLLRTRKNHHKRLELLYSTSSISLIVLYSLI